MNWKQYNKIQETLELIFALYCISFLRCIHHDTCIKSSAQLLYFYFRHLSAFLSAYTAGRTSKDSREPFQILGSIAENMTTESDMNASNLALYAVNFSF